MLLNFEESDFNSMDYLPEGQALCTITKIEEKKSQNGNDMVLITFSDAFGNADTERFTITQKAMFRIAAVFKAAGIKQAMSLNTNLLKGKKLVVTKSFKAMELGQDDKEYKRYNYKFTAVGGEEQAAAQQGEEPVIPF